MRTQRYYCCHCIYLPTSFRSNFILVHYNISDTVDLKLLLSNLDRFHFTGRFFKANDYFFIPYEVFYGFIIKCPFLIYLLVCSF